MSEQRARKVPGLEQAVRGRANTTKGSGDIVQTREQPKQSTGSGGKNKIPKNLRYDLENALVGLCDVWFEDIKPYLIQNNIKVHAHTAPASGDHRQMPIGAPDCSHLDPAATGSACELCRLLFNASNSIESAVSQAASAVLPTGSYNSYLEHTKKNPFASYKKKAPPPRRRRQALAQEWRVPRLCRTYSLLSPPLQAQLHKRPNTEQHQRRQPIHCYFRRRPKSIDKSTQTPKIHPDINAKVHDEAGSTRPRKLAQCSQNKVNVMAPRMQQKKRQSIPHQSLFAQQDSGLRKLEVEAGKTNVAGPRPANTVTSSRQNRRHSQPPTLFQDDLIDIIAEKQLKLLFKSPPRYESYSSVNLLNAVDSYGERPKKMPWR